MLNGAAGRHGQAATTTTATRDSDEDDGDDDSDDGDDGNGDGDSDGRTSRGELRQGPGTQPGNTRGGHRANVTRAAAEPQGHQRGWKRGQGA